jgi:sarcosine oxidase gamma subunit
MAEVRPAWCRTVVGTVLSLRHFPGDVRMREAVASLGLRWPKTPNELTGIGPWLAWRSPTEAWLLGIEAAACAALLERLAPGVSPSAMAVDLSEAVVCFQIEAGWVEHVLARLVDASAVPSAMGCSTRCRMGDAAVMLLRLKEVGLWIAVERSLTDHVEAWLTYAAAAAAVRVVTD